MPTIISELAAKSKSIDDVWVLISQVDFVKI
jgi:hypothetical protein